MATANWALASQLQSQMPHTYTAMEHLIMAMADAHNNRGKTSFFGNDKGLKSYLKFEEKLKNALIALTMDGLVNRFESSEKFHEMLVTVFATWFQIFPNWTDAEYFAYEKILSDKQEAKKLIRSLIGLSS
jgi:hypothetical protein